MAGNLVYMSADRRLEAGIDYSNLTGSNVVIDVAMDDAVSTRVRRTPQGVLNGVAYANAGKGFRSFDQRLRTRTRRREY